jgi:putative sigma-54 modulation protein
MAAVDAVIDKLERQVIRAKERLRSARRAAAPLSWSAASTTVTPAAVEEGGVVEIRRVDMVPMFPEDAITRMEELGQTFFVFLNAQTQRVNVVYRRAGGGHGLIDPVVAP